MFDNLTIKGKVKIYKGESANENYLIKEINNLIVYGGREFVLSSILEKSNSEIIPQPNWGVWFWSFGTGGLYNPSDPTTKKIPYPTDEDLEEPITTLDISVPGTTPNRRYRRTVDTSFLIDPINGNRYLIAALTNTIATTECANLVISEAGLFMADSPNPLTAGSFRLFSRITFEGIYKSETFPLFFVWYLYA